MSAALQLQRAAVTGGRYRKRVAAMSATVTGSGRYRRPLQEAGSGDGSGRYINNVLRQHASAASVRVQYHMQLPESPALRSSKV
jgi:hypothetical protein